MYYKSVTISHTTRLSNYTEYRGDGMALSVQQRHLDSKPSVCVIVSDCGVNYLVNQK